MKAQIHPYYDLSFEGRGSDTLIVIFSPNVKHALRKHPFRHDCLFISDRKLFYYLFNPGKQSLLLQEFIERSLYERAIFLGSSKGGAGALLWSSLVFRRITNCRIYCMAFSPQTRLYPPNENLISLPSYVGSLKMVERSAAYRVNAEVYGDIAKFIKGRTPPTRVVYSAKYKMDRVEAEFLADNDAVHLVPIDVAFHGSIVPFLTNLADTAQLDRLATKLYADAENDVDLRSALPERREDFRSMFSKLRCLPLNDYIDQFCGLTQRAKRKPPFRLSGAVVWMRTAMVRLVAVAVSLGLIEGLEAVL